MSTQDTCCTLVPYFKVHAGKLEAFKALGEKMVEKTRSESKCMHYGFSFNDHEAHCREGYTDAQGILAHLENVDELLKQALEIADITRLEVHAPAGEIEQLRDPLSGLNPAYFVLETGFRN